MLAEPDGRAGQVFWMLGSLGGEADTNRIREAMAREGDALPSAWLRTLLRNLCQRGLIEQAAGRRYRADGGTLPAVWRFTPAARAVLAAADGMREPCGTGWPAAH